MIIALPMDSDMKTYYEDVEDDYLAEFDGREKFRHAKGVCSIDVDVWVVEYEVDDFRVSFFRGVSECSFALGGIFQVDVCVCVEELP